MYGAMAAAWAAGDSLPGEVEEARGLQLLDATTEEEEEEPGADEDLGLDRCDDIELLGPASDVPESPDFEEAVVGVVVVEE